ncbi:2-succinylbenzoate--CoA ligase [Zhongshania aliphaticivorans]|uniref:2-succinylbenzoate--CoA ligase n=1 Tax=Zhongshania aliphaticivorans TaxID=1470434 RepID=A0A5S9MZI3_9GAMM|nr:AMP-binding protein [Zhongshania aliphaticivorans]CAA0082315.1 2-succinylbenzoate--CoA ligase [Zhongshania aliphaticivorans]CAA0084305.1 2-succinylbenzoate--CoA ligase [Zhongshania aliphaticivorans]
MSKITQALAHFATQRPEQFALVSSDKSYTYATLNSRVTQLANELSHLGIPVMGLYADNSPDWLVVDLACQIAGITLIPLPDFFTVEQIAHALNTTGAGAVLCDQLNTFLGDSYPTSTSWGWYIHILPPSLGKFLHLGTTKITFTSGSTGYPKGVCLAQSTMDNTAGALVDVLDGINLQRHLCALPLPALLENVAGAYSALLRGGTLVLPPLKQLGFTGSSSLDIDVFTKTLSRSNPQSLILLPQVLKALLAHNEHCGWTPPSSLRFVAVGGARVAPALIHRAREIGLPVYEGYGLSECGSVISLNRPGADRPGTAGQPLPHCELSFEHGEACVSGSRFLGYIGSPSSVGSSVYTGDLGEINDGFLTISGRSKNLLISSFGRNIEPEWPESELLASPVVQQCVVVGEDRPYCVALIWANIDIPGNVLQNWIDAANSQLPDYACIQGWARLPRPLSVTEDELTANGRPRRDVINTRYQSLIESLYSKPVIKLPNPNAAGENMMQHMSSHDENFYPSLLTQTEFERRALYDIEFIQRGTQGALSREDYVAFLSQAYHHVKHTVPLLMACGSRLTAEQEWLRVAIAEYIEEETGHQEWILNDIGACGIDPDTVRYGQPSQSTELMIAYVYDTIARGNPVGFFGMVLVLEGTSIAIADKAAEAIQESLGLPTQAFSYLRSHGALDIEHVNFYKGLMNKIEKIEDQRAITHCAQVIYKLYGNIFRELGEASDIHIAA